MRVSDPAAGAAATRYSSYLCFGRPSGFSGSLSLSPATLVTFQVASERRSALSGPHVASDGFLRCAVTCSIIVFLSHSLSLEFSRTHLTPLRPFGAPHSGDVLLHVTGLPKTIVSFNSNLKYSHFKNSSHVSYVSLRTTIDQAKATKTVAPRRMSGQDVLGKAPARSLGSELLPTNQWLVISLSLSVCLWCS